MNNKPVAWMETYKGEPNNLDWDKSNLNYGSEFHDVIPLYTHEYERPHNTVLVPCDKLAEMQAEIERLTMLCDCMTTESNRKGNEIEALKQILAYEGIGVGQDYLDECVADLRKAQEKNESK